MNVFTFHLGEKTVRALLVDPLLPASPKFSDVKAALVRLIAREDAEIEERRADAEKRRILEIKAIRLELERDNGTAE